MSGSGTRDAGSRGPIVIDRAAPYGYSREADLQQRFELAAAALLASDGWSGGGSKELVADLALEGGGVKGIGIVGAVSALAEAGYRFQRVAGTSAGAIAAALIAAISKKGDPMTTLQGYLDNLTFTEFMPQGKVHAFLDHHFGNAGEVLSSAEVLTHKMGVYDGTYLFTWLEPIMHDLGVHTFADLKITLEEDPGMSLPESHRYRLLVHTSDVTRGQLVRLPWDYDHYGLHRDTQDVAHAVRASMSIPFFFEPVTVTALPAEVDVPSPGGGSVATRYAGGTVTWVDGGMLRNFPIDAFDREDGGEPRWPTIGVKLSSLQTEYASTKAADSAFGEARGCLHTMMGEWDSYSVDAATAGRTIFVDNAGIYDHGLRPEDGAATRALPQRRHGSDRLRHRDGCAREGPAQRERGAPARAGAFGDWIALVEPVGTHHDQVALGPHCRRLEAGVAQPAQLVGQRRGPVVVGGDRGERVRRVEGDHHVAEHEATAGAQRAGDAGEEVRLVRTLEMVDGQGRHGEVEGAAGQRVGQFGHPQLDPELPEALPRRAEHRLVLVDPDRERPGVALEHCGQGLARPGPEVEHRRHRQPARRRRGDGLLEAPVGGDLLAHQVQVGGGVEVELAHVAPVFAPVMENSRLTVRSISCCERSHDENGLALPHESRASRRTQAQRSTKRESPSVTTLMISSTTPLAPLPHTPCCRS